MVDVIYFDFAKAFDTVPHRRLLKKLEEYGVKNEVLLWVESFLKDRHQLVKVHGAKSEKKKVLSGVPQGIVFGLLFLMYINDLPEVVRAILYLFADDTKLIKTITSLEDSILLQNDINALEKWSKTWLLNFHPNKCHVLTLGKFENIRHSNEITCI